MSAGPALPADPLALAHAWAARGVPVFPVAIGPNGRGLGKRPLCQRGYLAATTDPGRVDRMFARAHPRPGEVLAVGLHPGGADLVVFDLDRKHGRDGVAFAEQYRIPPTWTATTPTGGQHRYYRRPPGVRVTNHSPWADYGVDIRADRGFVVAPGTITPWGTWAPLAGQRWADDVEPIDPGLLALLQPDPLPA